jgi:hypothetical protein
VAREPLGSGRSDSRPPHVQSIDSAVICQLAELVGGSVPASIARRVPARRYDAILANGDRK